MDGKKRQPRRPSNMPDYTEACLQALAVRGLGEKLSLGGGVGLLHYFDYRSTHDVDAWWTSAASEQDRHQVVEVIETVLRASGQVITRSWGDVTSVELQQGGKTVFGFQIAQRSALLEPPARAPWIDVLLDSFSDLLSSKMVALVERGAPRDFRDIHALCQAELTTPQECWDLWRRRQRLTGSDTDSDRARLAVQTHLARIAQYRPLEQISDSSKRAEAEEVRAWFEGEFLDALAE